MRSADLDVGARLPVVLKPVDPRMLEEPADERPDRDAIAHAREAGFQAADAAHDEVDPHAGAGGAIEGLDHLVIGHRVQLQHDAGGPARGREVGLAIDEREHFRPETDRRDEQLAIAAAVGVAGDVVEEIRDVFDDRRA